MAVKIFKNITNMSEESIVTIGVDPRGSNKANMIFATYCTRRKTKKKSLLRGSIFDIGYLSDLTQK